MSKELAGSFIFTVDAFRKTKHGGIKITLDISEDQAVKALAIALVPDAVYSADIFLEQNEVFGSQKAE